MDLKTLLTTTLFLYSLIIFGKGLDYSNSSSLDSLLQVSIITQDVLCYGDSTGIASIDTITGGVPPYSVFWSTGTLSNTLENLSAGTYSYTITDALNSSIIDTFCIKEPYLDLTINVSINQPWCTGANAFIIVDNQYGGTSPYSVEWSDGSILGNISKQWGTHSVTVTDSNGCTVADTVTVEVPPCDLAINPIVQHVSCKGASDGSVIVYTQGCTSQPLSYCGGGLTGGPCNDNNFFGNLAAGEYIFHTYNSYCSTTIGVTITEPEELSISSEIVGIDCTNEFGSISLDVNGGYIPYNIFWEDGSMSNNLDSLNEGTYTVTVVDNGGCQIIDTFFMKYPLLEEQNTIQKSLSCNDTSLIVTLYPIITDTLPNYVYHWLNENGDTLINISPYNSQADSSGLYTLVVTDTLSGCTNSSVVEVSYNLDYDPPIISTQLEVVLCSDSPSILLDGTTNLLNADATVFWTDTNETILVYSDFLLVDEPGIYFYNAINNSNGCSSQASVQVVEGGEILSDPAIFPTNENENSGQIIPYITGGLPPYDYTWSHIPLDVSVLIFLEAGEYFLTVTDNNGCTASFIYEVGIISNTRTLPENCDIHIHPNPANNLLFIELNNKEYSQLNIYNIAGQLIQSHTALEEKNDFDLSVFPQGLYIFHFQNASGISYQEKVLIQR